MLPVTGFSQVHCRQRGKCPSIIQTHNGWGVVISVSFAVIVYASCDLLHLINAKFFKRRHTDGGWQNTRCLQTSPLCPCLPPSFLPSLAGGVSEPAYKLWLADDPVPSLFPSPLPSRRRKGTSPHSKVHRRTCSTSPSLPLYLLLSLSPSLPVPPFLPCRRRQGTSPKIKVRRRSRSILLSLSLPLPSFVGGDREPAHTLRLTEDRGLKRLFGMATKQSSSRRPCVSGTNCLWHKLDSDTKISRQSRTPLNVFSLSIILICK